MFRDPKTQDVCFPDYALFADTDWEPQGVYDTVAWLRNQVPFPVLTINNGRSLREDVENGVNSRGRPWLSIPAYLSNQDGTIQGRNWRQCTTDYKIVPIQRTVRELLGLPYRRAVPSETKVEMWLGITMDEMQRMKASQEPWIEHRFPLIEDKPMTRDECVAWFQERYPDRILSRSACIGCPFRNAASWVHVRESDPDGFVQAVKIDHSLRDPEHHVQGMFRGEVYLHPRRLPLVEAVDMDAMALSERAEKDGFTDECGGHCGI